MKYTVFLILLLAGAYGTRAQPLHAKLCRLQINVTDMRKALDFYVDKLGFSIKSGNEDAADVAIQDFDGEHVLLLHKVKKLNPITILSVGPCITLQVNNLDSAVTSLAEKGISFKNHVRRKEGVGFAIFCEDPFGTPISLMHQTIVETPHFNEPKIYNYGLMVTDMDSARSFYKRLGFVERSTRYLPDDMPLGYPDGRFAFMLHYREGMVPVASKSLERSHLVLLLEVQDIEAVSHQHLQCVRSGIQKDAFGEYLLMEDNSGIVSQIRTFTAGGN